MLKNGCQFFLVAGLLLLIVNTIRADEYNIDELCVDCYEAHINSLIEKCENKKMYRHSQSDELRKLAALSTMKLAYLREYKLELINEMAQHQIGNQDHQIQYFINSKFFNIARNQ
jgi:hypothetical protein